jgi:hypothetical protein
MNRGSVKASGAQKGAPSPPVAYEAAMHGLLTCDWIFASRSPVKQPARRLFMAAVNSRNARLAAGLPSGSTLY